MRRLAGLALILAAAFALFFVGATTDSAGPASRGDPTGFDAGQAFALVETIGARPHPVGSPANAAVRDQLVRRMTALRLAPRVQRAQSEASQLYGHTLVITQAPVENIIGVLPGRDRQAPALALMAHYDSVPGSPGAADDAAGVASALGTVQALAAQGAPARDVMMVVTDGEEAGLMGARAFFGDDPAAGRVGFVINLEARGGGGRPAMFQTGPRQGEADRLFAREERGASANSALALVYRLMPNDTDFSVALRRGVPGFNIAFIGRQFDYHSPSSTPAALDRGSLRLMGEETLALARPLAFDPALPKASPDLVYSDLFGRIIVYPAAFGWALVGLAAALCVIAGVQGASRERPSLRWLGSGVVATLALIAAPAALLFLARAMIGAPAGWMSYRPILARFPLFEAAMLAAALAGLLICGPAFGDRSRSSPRWVAALGVGVLAAAAIQALAPSAAFVFTWPLLAAGLIAALTGAGSRSAPALWIAAGVIAVADLAWLGILFHSLLEGLDAAPFGAVLVWLAGLALWPFLVPAAGERRAAVAGAVVALAIAAGLTAWMRLGNPYDARHPRAVTPIELQEADGSLWRADLAPANAWTRQWLGPGTIVPLPVAGAPGEMVGEEVGRDRPPALPVAWSVRKDGALVFQGVSGASGELYLYIDAARPLAGATLGGRTLQTGRASSIRLIRDGAPTGLALVVKPSPGDAPKVRWAFWVDAPAPELPVGLMAWDKAGDHVIAADPGLPPHR